MTSLTGYFQFWLTHRFQVSKKMTSKKQNKKKQKQKQKQKQNQKQKQKQNKTTKKNPTKQQQQKIFKHLFKVFFHCWALLFYINVWQHFWGGGKWLLQYFLVLCKFCAPLKVVTGARAQHCPTLVTTLFVHPTPGIGF